MYCTNVYRETGRAISSNFDVIPVNSIKSVGKDAFSDSTKVLVPAGAGQTPQSRIEVKKGNGMRQDNFIRITWKKIFFNISTRETLIAFSNIRGLSRLTKCYDRYNLQSEENSMWLSTTRPETHERILHKQMYSN